MTPIKKNFTIAFIPILMLVWGIFMILFFDPFYSKSSDPEFPYLINGLNCALLKFNYIGHFDHPGTPLQVFNGIVIRITHLFLGEGDISQAVFARPELYLNAISFSLLLTQIILVFAVGMIGIKREIPFWQISLLQFSCLFNDVLIWLFCRITPDRFFMIVVLIFILIYLKHGYKNHSSRKFALWSGVIMALGMATKFNFLPLLILPLLFINTNKNRLIYAGSGLVSFFIFISPIIEKFNDYRRFIIGIFLHDGQYGSGASKVFNIDIISSNIELVFKLNPGLFLLIPTLLFLVIIAFRKRGTEGLKGFTILFLGFLSIIIIQIIMVSKHFANYYLVPLFSIYGFMFFSISIFLSKLLKNRNQLILTCSILPLVFIFFTAVKVKDDFTVILKLKDQREKARIFVTREISKEDFWFVEPTWESGPHVENAIVYGLSYCGYRKEYLPQLMAVNPNVVTYEGNPDQVKLWRCTPVSLDSVVATGKNVYVYSTPGRKAALLLQMLQEAASRNAIQLQIDTIYNDTETERRIIRAKGLNVCSTWQTKDVLFTNRKAKIENFINEIKSSPEWLEKVKEKAINKNISLDSMILLDAIWMVDNGS